MSLQKENKHNPIAIRLDSEVQDGYVRQTLAITV